MVLKNKATNALAMVAFGDLKSLMVYFFFFAFFFLVAFFFLATFFFATFFFAILSSPCN